MGGFSTRVVRRHGEGGIDVLSPVVRAPTVREPEGVVQQLGTWDVGDGSYLKGFVTKHAVRFVVRK